MVYNYLRRRLRDGRKTMVRFADAMRGGTGQVRARIPAIRGIVAGQQPGGPKHAVYVHFDRWGVVHDYIHHALRELQANGYAVTFVSNSPKKLDDDQLRPILPLVREIVHRRNVGYDFAAYRDGIRRLPPLDSIERLLILNDSVYGPIYPLERVEQAAVAAGVDAFGITDSWEMHYHLQSYFLMFFPGALRSKAFQKFWRNFPTVSDKSWMIRNGEVRLSNVMARNKLRLGALCPYWDVSRALLAKLDAMDLGENSPLTPAERKFCVEVRDKIIGGKALNPSHYYWDVLVRDWGCPFLKRELVLTNPAGVPRPWSWEPLLRQTSTYDVGLVQKHLRSL